MKLKRFISIFLTLALVLLSGCTAVPARQEAKQYTATFLGLFDTVTTVVGRAESEEAFQERAQQLHDELLVYHQLFDIYNDYEGMNNLKTVNDNAGLAPVEVSPIILELLRDCREYHDLTDGRVNVAMGSVLHLWHEARSDGLDDPKNARLPDHAALEAAAEHCSMEDVIIDEAAGTVYLRDADMRLDVGAVAKGWAAQRVSETAPEGLLFSVGGNVCATGAKDDAGTPWVIGIQNPDGGDYLHTIYHSFGSVVTSGDYQRAYAVDGVVYHHIIDPDTRYPATLWRAVTVVSDDSGLADCLSTALFLLPLEEGLALLKETGAEAMWVNAAGEEFFSPGFEALIRT